MTCKHGDQVTKIVLRNSRGELVQMKCDCGAVLPLGPSNDDSEAVRIEIRAAELTDEETIWTPEEIGGGYVAAHWEPGAPFSDKLDNGEQYAGYLARRITHGKEPTARMHPMCVGVTRTAPWNVQCLRCNRYGQRCDWNGTNTTHEAS